MSQFIVLLFHSTDDREQLSLKELGNIRPELFENTLQSLKKEFDIVSLSDIVECISERKDCKERLLAITFDDGPKSYAINAVPVMDSLEIPSTCFLITDCIGDKEVYCRYLYNFCIQSGKGKELADLIKQEYGIFIQPEEIIRFTRNNYNKNKSISIMRNILEEIISKDEYNSKEGELFLSVKDIDALKKNQLVNFGIHTHTHPVMMRLSDEEIHEEIAEGLDFYKRNINGNKPMFSIPFGRLYKDYDERTIITAGDLSVDVMLSAYGGDNKTGQPLYNIRRLPVNEGMLKEGNGAFIRSLNNIEVPSEYAEKEAYLNSVIQKK